MTPSGASNAVEVEVLPPSPPSGRVAWRFRADSPGFRQRPAVASDGTVYAQDSRGFLYALGADGNLRWIYNAGGYPQGGGGEGPVALGADGTVYVAANPLGPDVQVHAVNPDGTRRWVFTDSGGQGVIAGPNIGPDGNLYVVTDYGGRGIFSLTPTGQLRWSNTGSPPIIETGQTGAELVFGARSANGPVEHVYCAFDERGVAPNALLYAFRLGGGQHFAVAAGGDGNVGQLQPAVGPGGTVYLASLGSSEGIGLRAYNPSNGSVVWSYAIGSPTNVMTPATVGVDGTIYVGRNLGEIHAVSPNGSALWVHSENIIFHAPMPSPTNNAVIAGGRITYGDPGLVQAFHPASGQTLWRVDLPLENGLVVLPESRAVFSADGARAYIVTTILGIPNDGREYSFLYALGVDATCPSISVHPVSTTVCVGADATFRVSASGTPPFSYQWYRNGATIPAPGGTGVTLSVSQATMADTGMYVCVVSNRCGSAASNPAVLTVVGCGPTCDPDVNCDGSVDGFDVEAMEQAVGGDMANFCQNDPDFNRDGSVDGFDVEALERVVGGAPCP